jgi:hypothetical protein
VKWADLLVNSGADMHPTVKRWIDAINAQSVSQLEELATKDHVFFVEGEEPVTGHEKIRPSWQRYFDAFPSYQIFIDEYYPEGRTHYLLGHTKGSHVPAPLESETSSVIWRCEVLQGRISVWSIYEGTQSNREKFGLPVYGT